MPTINIDDAYILDNTGQQVDESVDYAYANSNENQLDNPYFIGGGSQLGVGVFPINQRELTSYTNYGYGIDRWRNETAYASVTLASDGLKFCSNTSGQWGTMVQILRKEASIAGKTVTISAIIDGTLASKTYDIPALGGYDLTPASVGDVAFNLYSPNGTDIQFRFYTMHTTQHTISAAKLEFGPYSTLINDGPPNFWQELDKCLFDFERIKANLANLSIMTGYVNASNIFYVPIQIHPKRANPTITTNASLGIGKSALNLATSTGVYLFAASNNTGHYTLSVTASSGLTADEIYRIGILSGNYIDFSAEP